MSRQIRSAFLDHVAKMLELSGTPRSDAEPATRDEKRTRIYYASRDGSGKSVLPVVFPLASCPASSAYRRER